MTKLINVINILRAKAFTIYETMKSNKFTPEEIALALKELRETKEGAIRVASLSDKILALRSLKDQNRAHGESIAFFQQKILDNDDQILDIERIILIQMKEFGKKNLVEKDFSLSIIEENGKEKIVYR